MRSHDVHDAWPVAGMVEAYASVPVMHAASQYQLTDFDIHRFSHWQHSIQSEYNYLNPFDAVFSAWKLGWSIICDSFDEFIEAANCELPSKTMPNSDQLGFVLSEISNHHQT